MESASWQRPLYGFEISQNQAKMPLKSGFSDGLGGVELVGRQSPLFLFRKEKQIIKKKMQRKFVSMEIKSYFCRKIVLL